MPFVAALIKIVRIGAQAVGLITDVADEIKREKAREQAKLAPARKKMAEEYRKASNSAGKAK